MEALDYWKLCDELSIHQAALLIIGLDPSSDGAYVEQWEMDKRPAGYEAAKTALKNAVLRGDFPDTKIVPIYVHDLNGNICDERGIDIELTTISIFAIKQFLKKRGFKSSFFLLEEDGEKPHYLSRDCPQYSSKLAAAVEAWKALIENPELLKGKTPKQALEKWLREHAHDYGLTDEDGNPVNQTIDDIAKVANWKPGGGAAKTPSA